MKPPPSTPPSEAPFFTVVVPVHDGGPAFERCLASLAASGFQDFELVVVDDGSTDGSGALARRAGARVLRSETSRGPAAARNAGAREAAAARLFFLDADCAIHPDALGRAADLFLAEPDLAALFGSYDDRPADPGVVSRYRNILHHRVHHRGRRRASTFWAGCGAVRREAFEAAGGFDPGRYPRPSVEDIDLGVRLRARGGRILLDPAIQATHLKAWTVAGMVRTDALSRAAPWTRLALRTDGFPRDLNTGLAGRAAVAAAVAGAACLLAAPWKSRMLAPATAFGALMVALDLDLFRLLHRRGGAALALAAVPLHGLHHLAAAAGLAVGAAGHLRERAGGLLRSGAREGRRPGAGAAD